MTESKKEIIKFREKTKTDVGFYTVEIEGEMKDGVFYPDIRKMFFEGRNPNEKDAEEKELTFIYRVENKGSYTVRVKGEIVRGEFIPDSEPIVRFLREWNGKKYEFKDGSWKNLNKKPSNDRSSMGMG